MIIDPTEVAQIANRIIRMRQAEQRRLRRIGRYMEGKHDPPYAPKGVNAEYRWIMRKSRRNFLPLIVSAISGNMHVDGYRPSGYSVPETVSFGPAASEPAWASFEANRMISRQHGVHRSVIEYGAAYVVVLPGQLATDEELPGTSTPVIRPTSPRRMTALYAMDVDDEWPQVAIEVRTVNNAVNPSKQQLLVSLYDEVARYTMISRPGDIMQQGGGSGLMETETDDGGYSGGGMVVTDSIIDLTMADADDPNLGGQEPVAYHGLGVCPIVRFLYEIDLDGDRDCQGEVEPIMPIQDQINFSTFNEMMAEQYQAFRQRWVTGMAPVDVEGREQTPFRPGVDRVWAAEDPTTKFGEFSEAQLAQYLDSREAGIRHMATITQVPPYYLLGQVANLSAEALAAARDGLDRKVDELKSNLTDPWRNVFRLTALAAKDQKGWDDTNGQVVWRDSSARAFAATIDGLGKAATMLGIPVEELWPKIPGATADDVNNWKIAKAKADAEAAAQQAVQSAVQLQAAGVPVAPELIQSGTPGGPGGAAVPGRQPQQLPAAKVAKTVSPASPAKSRTASATKPPRKPT